MITTGADPGISRRGGIYDSNILNPNNTGAFPSASVLMDISIYVSLIRLRYVFNNVAYRITTERERERERERGNSHPFPLP